MATRNRAFWIDATYDRDHASDGVSRYNAYVRDRADHFDLDFYENLTDRAVDFAATAWRIATPPVMAPGYVRTTARVLASTVERSGWDGTLLATVDLAVATPAELARTAPGGGYWRGWDRGWDDNYLPPDEAAVAAAPYALTTTRLSIPLPADGLPSAPLRVHVPGVVEDVAHQAVAALVRELNRALEPVMSALGGGA